MGVTQRASLVTVETVFRSRAERKVEEAGYDPARLPPTSGADKDTLIDISGGRRTAALIPGAKFVGSKECAQCHENVTSGFHDATHAKLMTSGENAKNIDDMLEVRKHCAIDSMLFSPFLETDNVGTNPVTMLSRH